MGDFQGHPFRGNQWTNVGGRSEEKPAPWWREYEQKNLDVSRRNVEYFKEHPDSVIPPDERVAYQRDLDRAEASWRAATGKGPRMEWDSREWNWRFHGPPVVINRFANPSIEDLRELKRDVEAAPLNAGDRVPSSSFYGADAASRTKGELLADIDRLIEDRSRVEGVVVQRRDYKVRRKS